MNMKKTSNHPIGVFDSGLGGLTVLKHLLDQLPYEDFIYLGDLANLPYGNKSKKNIIDYSRKCAQFLRSKNVKSIIIACNTASSYAYKIIKESIDIPVFDVISPCVDEVVNSDSKNVVVLGTEKTIESSVYSSSIKIKRSNIKVYSKACPLFVPVVEEGLEGTEIAHSIIDYYLKDIRAKQVDQLILGCTHYPILIEDLKKYFGKSISILHSGPIIAKNLSLDFEGPSPNPPQIYYYVTDSPERFKKYGSKFLSKKINSVNLVAI